MKTEFAEWLVTQGLKPYQFAARHGVHRLAVYRLCGIKLRYDRAPPDFRAAVLHEISGITGIASEKLFGDAVAAMRDPAEPRKYQRKGGSRVAAE